MVEAIYRNPVDQQQCSTYQHGATNQTYPPGQTSDMYPKLEEGSVQSLAAPDSDIGAPGSSYSRKILEVAGAVFLFCLAKSIDRVNPGVGLLLRFCSLVLAIDPAFAIFKRMGFGVGGKTGDAGAAALSLYWNFHGANNPRGNSGWAGSGHPSQKGDSSTPRTTLNAEVTYSATGAFQFKPHSSSFSSQDEHDPHRDKSLTGQPLIEADD